MSQEKSFIEVQFPVSKISKESYKERKANLGQTLTGLGKWWGRKPLVLVRAVVLGLLMPASDNPQKDREIFLKIMTMDKNGLHLRRNKSIKAADAREVLTAREAELYLNVAAIPKWKTGLSSEEKREAVEKAWNRFTYDKKLTYCLRPEAVENRTADDWKEINRHLSTCAASLTELVEQLGVKKFGRRAVIGDCFCGGGSVPFEAARMGNDVFASDLNPVAGLLTWADIVIAGADNAAIETLRDFQQKVYAAVDRQFLEWGIESNAAGDRANAYLYCHETVCPECGYRLPLAPSWVIGRGTKTVAVLRENSSRGFDINIKSDVSVQALRAADECATVRNGSIYCPHCQKTVPMTALRKNSKSGNGLRHWEKSEFTPRESDLFGERLYCIRYTAKDGTRYYKAPNEQDLERENRTVALLAERFASWQEKGYIPGIGIETGDKTSELIRTRGFHYWHQLFNPRQLLTQGLFMQKLDELATTKEELVIGLLGINKVCEFNSKLSWWVGTAGVEKPVTLFYNQALNPLFNYGCSALRSLKNCWQFTINHSCINAQVKLQVADARQIKQTCDFWITDPPYADAVNYHELSEFFLAWDKNMLKKAFPDRYADSKRILAVRGRNEVFNSSMIDIYTNLVRNMRDDGLQVIMFTHQDVSIWAELALIVWSAGLQVTAAWNIATETEASGLKDGNYVKGTVLLVLRKQTGDQTAYLDELYPDIEAEVKRQIDSMYSLDDKEEPNFADTDYILAAYAAALKVLTSVKRIEDIDVRYELSRERKRGELSPIARLIESAKKIAYDQLIPREFDHFIWRSLLPAERMYIKGLELEKNNTYQISAYQELARGFGVADYKAFMENCRGNTARLKTGTEWAGRSIGGEGSFAAAPLRHVLMATYLAAKKESNVQAGKNWLRNEIIDYWNRREQICEFLKYIAAFAAIGNMAHWHKEAACAAVLRELIANDGI